MHPRRLERWRSPGRFRYFLLLTPGQNSCQLGTEGWKACGAASVSPDRPGPVMGRAFIQGFLSIPGCSSFPGGSHGSARTVTRNFHPPQWGSRRAIGHPQGGSGATSCRGLVGTPLGAPGPPRERWAWRAPLQLPPCAPGFPREGWGQKAPLQGVGCKMSADTQTPPILLLLLLSPEQWKAPCLLSAFQKEIQKPPLQAISTDSSLKSFLRRHKS